MDVLEQAINELKGNQVEALITSESVDNLLFDNNEFKRADCGLRIKFEIRVTNGRRSGYAWTNNINKWRQCVSRAKRLMEASSELRIKPRLSNAKSINASFTHPLINKTTIELMRDKGFELINTVNDLGVNVPTMILTKKIITEESLNSNGVKSRQEQSEVNVQVECSADNSSAMDAFTSQGLTVDFQGIGESMADLCLKSRNPKRINQGLRPVVFDYNAISALISILLPSVQANNIIEHNSILESRINEQVINQKLTISDVGLIDNGTNNRKMDCEGTPITETVLFDKGVLNSYINDLYSAQRLNHDPTGNSAGLVKRGFVTNNNIIISEGEASSDELLRDCVYVNNLMGTHTANTVSGDFALSALNAFEYKNGEKTPVRDVMISGNIFELLKNVDLVGKKSRFDASLKTPMIRVKNVQVVC